MKSKKINKKNHKGKQNKRNKNSVKKCKRNIKGGRRKKVNSKKKNNKKKDNKKKSKRKTKYSQKGGNSIIQIFVITWDDYERLLNDVNFKEKISWIDHPNYAAGKTLFVKNKGFDRTNTQNIIPVKDHTSIQTDVVLCIEIKQNKSTEILSNDLKSIKDIGRLESLLKSETNNSQTNLFEINGMVTVAHIDKLPIITMRGIMSKSGTGSARHMLQGIADHYSSLEGDKKTYQFNFPVWPMLKNFAINTNLHTTFYTKDFRIIKDEMVDPGTDENGSKTRKYQAVILSIATKFPKLIATNNKFTLKDKNNHPIIYVNHDKSTVKINDNQTVDYKNFEDLLYTKNLAQYEDTKQLVSSNGLTLRGDAPVIFNLEDIKEGQNLEEIKFIEKLLKQKKFLQDPLQNTIVPKELQGKVVSVPDFYENIKNLDKFLSTFNKDSINDDISEFYQYPLLERQLKQLQSIDYFAKTIQPVKEVWKILKQIKDSRKKKNEILIANKINDIKHENIPTTLFSS